MFLKIRKSFLKRWRILGQVRSSILRDSSNVASLEAIESALFLVCLDGASLPPRGCSEKDEQASHSIECLRFKSLYFSEVTSRNEIKLNNITWEVGNTVSTVEVVLVILSMNYVLSSLKVVYSVAFWVFIWFYFFRVEFNPGNCMFTLSFGPHVLCSAWNRLWCLREDWFWPGCMPRICLEEKLIVRGVTNSCDALAWSRPDNFLL